MLNKAEKNLDYIGLNACVNIMKIWGFDMKEMSIILGISQLNLQTYINEPDCVKLNQDILDRVSFVLNIHADLRLLFSTPENVYGFISMPNHNDIFYGRSPKELLMEGSLENVTAVARYVRALRKGCGSP